MTSLGRAEEGFLKGMDFWLGLESDTGFEHTQWGRQGSSWCSHRWKIAGSEGESRQCGCTLVEQIWTMELNWGHFRGLRIPPKGARTTEETYISKVRPHLRNSVPPVSVEFLLWKRGLCFYPIPVIAIMLVLREVKQRRDQDNGRLHWGLSIQVSSLVTVSSGKLSLSLVS